MSSQTVFVTAGKTSFSHDISLVQNAGNTSPGDPMLSVAYNSASLTAYYRIPTTGASTAITLATQTVTGAYSSGGFVLISNTTNPGQYRFDPPNAVLATAGVTAVTFTGFAGLATHTVYYICQAVDMFTNTYISSNITRVNGTAIGTGPVAEWGIFESGTAVSATSTTLVGRAAATDDIVKAGMNLWAFGSTQGYWQSVMINSVSGDTFTITAWPNAVTPSGTITYIVYGTPQTPTALIPAVNMTQVAGQTATAAAGVTFPTSIASPTNITAASGIVLSGVTHTGAVIPTVTTTGTATNLTNAPTNGDLTATMKTSVTTAATAATPIAASVSGAVGSVTGNVGGNVAGSVGSVIGAVASVTGNVGGNVNGSVASVTTVNDKTGYRLSATGVDDVWDEPKAGHLTAGTYGVYLDAAVSGVSTGGVSVADIADAVWDEAIAAHLNVGSAGNMLNATNTNASQIKSKTDNLTFSSAGEVDANMKSVNEYSIPGSTPPFGD